MRKKPKVAVIIATFNEEKNIGQLIDSLKKNTYKNKEIIVVDGGSTDNTRKIARQKGAIVLLEKGKEYEKCPANAWNQGAKYTNADILCFMDADNFIEDKYFIEKAVKAFDKSTAAVTTMVRIKQDTLLERILLSKEYVSVVPTFVRRDVFLKLGGFPLLGFAEDQIFTERLRDYIKKNNLKEKAIRDTYFSKHDCHTLHELFKQYRWYGRTSVLALKQLRGKKLVIGFLKFYHKIIYFLSFLTLFLVPFSNLFIITAIPFFVIFFAILIKNFRGGYNIGKVLTSLFSGFAMLYGLIIFFIRKDARKGRLL